jgi:subtilisin family serine protease
VNDVALVQERNTELSIDKTFVHGLTQNGVVEVLASGGGGGFYIYSQSGKTYAADAYIDGGSFPEALANYEKLVGTPGGAANAITVGSYDWNDAFFYQGQMVEVPDFQLDKPLRIGRLSTYSSAGLARAGQVKPDIVAPGQWFTAPWTISKPAELPESSGQYALFNGTSAATPYTAGIIALLFEKQPALSLGELKDLLKSCATEDRPITGQVPNPNWGYGKLDVKALRKILKQLEPAPRE